MVRRGSPVQVRPPALKEFVLSAHLRGVRAIECELFVKSGSLVAVRG
jgi:hypothetical protein